MFPHHLVIQGSAFTLPGLSFDTAGTTAFHPCLSKNEMICKWETTDEIGCMQMDIHTMNSYCYLFIYLLQNSHSIEHW